MTRDELIEKLKKMPENAEVYTETDDYAYGREYLDTFDVRFEPATTKNTWGGMRSVVPARIIIA